MGETALQEGDEKEPSNGSVKVNCVTLDVQHEYGKGWAMVAMDMTDGTALVKFSEEKIKEPEVETKAEEGDGPQRWVAIPKTRLCSQFRDSQLTHFLTTIHEMGRTPKFNNVEERKVWDPGGL